LLHMILAGDLQMATFRDSEAALDSGPRMIS
jgi:hypothetical protein